MKNKQKIIVFAALAIVAVTLFLGGRGAIEYTRAAEQAELETKQAELARLAAQESAQPTPEVKGYGLAIPAPTPTPTASQGGAGEAKETVTTEEDGSITVIPNFETQTNSSAKRQGKNETVSANLGGSGGGDLPLVSDGVYHGDHPATPAPGSESGSGNVQAPPAPAATVSAKPTATTSLAPTSIAESTKKPAEAPEVTSPASTPAATSEPPTASQKPNEDDSGSGDKPASTTKPSQGQDQGGGADNAPAPTTSTAPSVDPGSSDSPPSRNGRYDGERSPDGKYEWWGVGFNEWVKIGGSDGGSGGDGQALLDQQGVILTEDMKYHKVGNM